jgi:hypothetical protein
LRSLLDDPGCRYVASEALIVRSWDGELGVVFDRRVARTHLVSAAAAAVLQAVRGRGLNLSELEAAVTPMDSDAAGDGGTRREMAALVEALQQAGLLWRQSCRAT